MIREFAAIRPDQEITVDTRIEADLGITGDDGIELLRAAAVRFDVDMGLKNGRLRSVFGLEENEYLFNSEGWSIPLVGAFYRWVVGSSPSVIRDLTVGELLAAIQRVRASG